MKGNISAGSVGIMKTLVKKKSSGAYAACRSYFKDRKWIKSSLDQGLSYRQVQMMSGHKDPKTVMRYDHQRENLDQNAVNHLSYEGS